jgi:hypothetical protein
MQEHQDHEDTLSEWLRGLAEADAASGASPAVRERLLEELRARRRARRVAAVKMYALAAGLVIATALSVWQLTFSRPADQSPRMALSAPDAEVATRFFPLAYSTLPVTRANIVRVEVSPEAFAALGVERINALGSPRDVVLADVLVGEDGLARAVRFVGPARGIR